MKHTHFLYLTAIIFYIVYGSGCANIVAPTGGPRDSLPPVLVSVIPKDSAHNFTGNKISFSFNEYVEVQNIQDNLVVSPTPKVNPIIDYKLRTVTVKLKDTLEQNTTYAINFGNSIRDINEGNVLKNFTYVFTTGDKLDNGSFSGKVLLAETGKPDSTLIALLHRSEDDSVVIKERPRYYAKLDSSGNFNFHFLVPGTYYLYALKDETGTRKYLSKGQLFAFAEKPVVIGENTAPVTLYAYIEKEEKKPVISQQRPTLLKAKKEEENRLKFQTNLENGQQDILGDFQLIFNDSLKLFDSSKVIFTDEKFSPITGYAFKADSTNRIYTLHYPWKENTGYNLILDKNFATDSLERKLLKTDTIAFKTKKETDYGSVRLRFPDINLEKKPVLQLSQNGKIVFSYPLTTKEFYTKLFKPGDYDILILYDTNGNGAWDPGVFFGKHIQPEKVQSANKKLTVKGNWDNEVNVQLL